MDVDVVLRRVLQDVVDQLPIDSPASLRGATGWCREPDDHRAARPRWGLVNVRRGSWRDVRDRQREADFTLAGI